MLTILLADYKARPGLASHRRAYVARNVWTLDYMGAGVHSPAGGAATLGLFLPCSDVPFDREQTCVMKGLT